MSETNLSLDHPNFVGVLKTRSLHPVSWGVLWFCAGQNGEHAFVSKQHNDTRINTTNCNTWWPSCARSGWRGLSRSSIPDNAKYRQTSLCVEIGCFVRISFTTSIWASGQPWTTNRPARYFLLIATSTDSWWLMAVMCNRKQCTYCVIPGQLRLSLFETSQVHWHKSLESRVLVPQLDQCRISELGKRAGQETSTGLEWWIIRKCRQIYHD